MKHIHCSRCDIPLVQVPENTSPGAIAHVVMKEGFVAKNSVLYTGTNNWYWYCSESCQKVHYAEVVLRSVPADRREAVTSAMSELRKEIPEMARKTGEAIEAFRQKLYKLSGRGRDEN